MKWRVLVTCPQLQATIHLYDDLFAEREIKVESPDLVQILGETELLDLIDGFDGVIAGDDQFTARVLEKGRRLKVISRWGVGVDGIDLSCAERLGIQVSNTPNAFSDEAGDVVMAYIILLARQLHQIDRAVRSGSWSKFQGVSLRGKTLGVIGVGNIGRAVGRRANVAGMTVVGHDVAPLPEKESPEYPLHFVELHELLRVSDFISLNCNLTPSNRHMLGGREFKMMKDGVFVINTARGPLIDEAALSHALERGKVAGAALDVFETEPLPMDSPLRRFDNCIFGSHNTSNTYEAVLRVNERAIQNLIEGLESPRD